MTTNTTRPVFDAAALATSLGALTAAASAPAGAAPAKDKATIYLGIGQLREGVDMEAIDPSKDFVNLPQLIGLDNMRPDDRRASTQEFADQQAEKNEFLHALVEEALATLQPGETRLMPFYVTIYRKKDEVVATPAARARPKTSFFA